MLLLDEVRDAWRSEPADHRRALVVIVAIAIVLRLANLAQPMRYDESITYLEFVRYPLTLAMSSYRSPSNHLFYTLLAKGAVGIFGPQPWALRVPAFLAGVLLVPATWAVMRAIYGARAALIAAALVAASGVLTLYSTNARGYTIVCLAFLALVASAQRLIRESSSDEWARFSLVAAIGLWTIPVMLYPLGAVLLWIAFTFVVEKRRGELRWLAGSVFATVALTTLAYMPVFRHLGVAAVTRNRFVTSSLWPDFLQDMFDSTPQALDSWGLGLPPLVSVALLLVAIYALTKHAEVSSTRVSLPLAVYVWTAWLLVVTHRAPFPRIWMWMVPVAAGLVGAGMIALLERWPRARSFAEHRVPLLATILAAGMAASVALSGGVRLATDTGAYADASTAAATLKPIVRAGDRVVAAIPTLGPLAFYMRQLRMDSTLISLDEAKAHRMIVVVDQGAGQTLGPILESTAARDTANFTTSIAATLPGSTIFLFTRRDAKK